MWEVIQMLSFPSKKCLVIGFLSMVLPVVYERRLRTKTAATVRTKKVSLSSVNSFVHS